MHYFKCKVLYMVYTLPTIAKLKLKGILLNGISYFAGAPYMTRKKGSTISIGKGCRFMSKSWGNLIGLYHQCILATTEKDAKIVIGDGCSFSGVSIRCYNEIVLGKNVRCGANVLIMDGDGHLDDPRSGKSKPVHIGDNVWLGTDVKVMKGVTIGANSLIGAGSIVTKDIPANVIAVGSPCRVIRSIDEETIKKLEQK